MAIVDAVLLLQMPRDGRVILNDLAIVIGDPDRPVRTVRQIHRMTPRVRRSGKLALLLARRAPELKHRAILLNHGAVDQIPGWLAHKILAVQPWQRAVPIDERAAGRGKPAIRLTFCGAV